jgi:hypothetical protein
LHHGVTSLYAFPKKLKEVSGITYIPESKLLWVIEDSGNANKIYGLNPKENSKKASLSNAENIDWEELLRIKKKFIYENKRRFMHL